MRSGDLVNLKPTRGHIVIDASVLIPMAVDLPDTVLTEDGRELARFAKECGQPAPRLFELPLLLSRHGHATLIPEMVKYETIREMEDGTSIAGHFGDRRHADEEVLADLFNLIRDFHGHISVTPTKRDTDAGRLLHIMRLIDKADPNLPPHLREYLIRGDITFMQKNVSRQNFGEFAAFDVIRSIQNPTAPIFFLSEDIGALDDATRARRDGVPVHGLRFGSLYEAMREEGLLNAAILKDIPYDEFYQHVQDSLGDEVWNIKPFYGDNPEFRETLRGIGQEIATSGHRWTVTRGPIPQKQKGLIPAP